MNNTEFKAVVEKQLADCLEIMRLKGADYPMDSSDRLSNFKHAARRTGINTLQNWLGHFLKHEECIEKYVRGEYHDSEPIFSRISDAINYLILLRALIEEQFHSETDIIKTGLQLKPTLSDPLGQPEPTKSKLSDWWKNLTGGGPAGGATETETG